MYDILNIAFSFQTFYHKLFWSNYCYSNYCQCFFQRYYGVKSLPSTADCLKNVHNNFNAMSMENKVHGSLIVLWGIFVSLQHVKLPVIITVPATLWYIVYIYMTAVSSNLISGTTILLNWYFHSCILFSLYEPVFIGIGFVHSLDKTSKIWAHNLC